VQEDSKSLTKADVDALKILLGKLSPEKKRELFGGVVENKPIWVPTVGPQVDAYRSDADELFYGGQAGGGKSDLGIGLSLTKHERSLVLRRTHKQAQSLVDRYTAILGGRQNFNAQDMVFRLEQRQIDVGGCQHEEDKQKYKGNPHDLIFFDEVSDFEESQYRFIIGWNRSATPGQRCRIVCAGNPPTRPEGLWVLNYWAPWLDKTHRLYGRVKPGELLWFTTIAGEDTLVDGPGPHEINGMQIPGKSRTFIPATLQDNPFLADTNYLAQLAGMQDRERRAYMLGEWDVGQEDAPDQVIPSAWVMQAQARWKEDGWKDTLMTAMAMDPAGGGDDAEILIYRHGAWISKPMKTKGAETADGSRAAAKIVENRRHDATVVIDVGGGYGGAVMLRLKDNGIKGHAFNGQNKSTSRTRDKALAYFNKRAEAWWRLREELDPDQEGGCQVALPPGPEVIADLCAPKWQLGQNGIQIESKKDIRKRIGRSPDVGDAIVMCLSEGEAVITRRLADAGRRRSIKNIRTEPKRRKR
jgi:hypothetical protein